MRTPIHPTEDPEKVQRCFQKIMEGLEIEEEKTETGLELVMKSSEKSSLYLIQEKLRQQRILDSARKILLRSLSEDSVTFFLNKQAAFTGRIHFVKDPQNEDFLGPITVTISSDEIQGIVDWLTLDETKKK